MEPFRGGRPRLSVLFEQTSFPYNRASIEADQRHYLAYLLFGGPRLPRKISYDFGFQGWALFFCHRANASCQAKSAVVTPNRQRPCCVANGLPFYAFGQISASGLEKIGLALIARTQQRSVAYILSQSERNVIPRCRRNKLTYRPLGVVRRDSAPWTRTTSKLSD